MSATPVNQMKASSETSSSNVRRVDLSKSGKSGGSDINLEVYSPLLLALASGKAIEMRSSLVAEDWEEVSNVAILQAICRNVNPEMARVAKEKIELSGMVFAKPLIDLPKEGSTYFVVDVQASARGIYPIPRIWTESVEELLFLENGLIHLNRVDAYTHGLALVDITSHVKPNYFHVEEGSA